MRRESLLPEHKQSPSKIELTKNFALLQTYLGEAQSNAHSFRAAEHYYKNVQRYMGLTSVVLGWVGLFVGSLEFFEDPPVFLIILFLFGSGGSSIINSVMSYMNLQNRISAQHTSCAQYTELAGNIELFLAQDNLSNEDLRVYVSQIHDVKEIYDGNAPLISAKFERITEKKKRDHMFEPPLTQLTRLTILPKTWP